MIIPWFIDAWLFICRLYNDILSHFDVVFFLSFNKVFRYDITYPQYKNKN